MVENGTDTINNLEKKTHPNIPTKYQYLSGKYKFDTHGYVL